MSDQIQQKSIGHYVLLEVLGRGSTGVVYKAYDERLKRYVAVKTLATDDSEHHKRFFRGARLAARLKHPHIIPVYDCGEQKDQLYIVTELLQGKDLKQMIQEGVQEPLVKKIEWMAQLCEALEFAHQEEIIHRDIKPANLYIRTNGNLIVTDFEIARGMSTDITKAGVIIGTPEYFSPEQIMMLRLDRRSDIFSAGLVCYELLTGTHPHRTETFPATLHKILNEKPVPPSELNHEISQKMDDAVLKALEKDINRRFATAAEMKTALLAGL